MLKINERKREKERQRTLFESLWVSVLLVRPFTFLLPNTVSKETPAEMDKVALLAVTRVLPQWLAVLVISLFICPTIRQAGEAQVERIYNFWAFGVECTQVSKVADFTVPTNN